jgi:hypothetical protein
MILLGTLVVPLHDHKNVVEWTLLPRENRTTQVKSFKALADRKDVFIETKTGSGIFAYISSITCAPCKTSSDCIVVQCKQGVSVENYLGWWIFSVALWMPSSLAKGYDSGSPSLHPWQTGRMVRSKHVKLCYMLMERTVLNIWYLSNKQTKSLIIYIFNRPSAHSPIWF